MQYIDFGTTPVIMNQQEFPGGDRSRALIGPAFLIDQKGPSEVEVSVASEPINVVGYRMILPTDPPWTALVPIGNLSVRIGGTTGGSPISDEIVGDGQQQVTLEVKGLPNDARFARLVELHENVHVADLEEQVARILRPWDRAISEFQRQGKKITASTAEEAIQKFYALVGGTPAQVATRFIDTLRDLGLAFHRTARGASPSIDRYTVQVGDLQNLIEDYTGPHHVHAGGPAHPRHIVRVHFKHPME